MFWCRDVLFLFGISSNLTLSPQRHEPRVLSLQIAAVQSSHTKLCIAEVPPVPKAASVPLQHSPVCHWLWNRSHMASWKQGKEAQRFLALPPQLYTPAVRCPSASLGRLILLLSSTQTSLAVPEDWVTIQLWQQTFLHAFAAPAAGLFLEGCHRAATWPHLNILLPCFANLKLFPELFPRSANKAKAQV